MDRTAFIYDQVHAASNETAAGVAAQCVDPRAVWVADHPAEGAIATRLALALVDSTVTLCEHTTSSPGRLVWTPDMTTLGCGQEYIAHLESKSGHTCDNCTVAVPDGDGLIMFALGPVTVLATLCEACRNLTADGAVDVAAVRFQALAITLDQLTSRWAGATP